MISGKTTKEHQKHVKLAKTSWGTFGRAELAILGAPCGEIKEMAFRIIRHLNGRYKQAYVDADHKSADQETEKDPVSALAHGASMEMIDKIAFKRMDYNPALGEYETKRLFNSCDLTLVNGNHFVSDEQIVIIHPNKSLENKLHKLTNVRLFVLSESVSEIPAYLKEHVTDCDSIPVHFANETEKLAEFTEKRLLRKAPVLNGLVLAGGKSLRMKQDKGKLDYHGKPQREYLYELLSRYCQETYISCRLDQVDELKDFKAIPDTFLELGPLGAILSAFRFNPDAAWLVVAADLPYVNKQTLENLIKKRDISKYATAYQQPGSDFPEPLIAIWEPRTYASALQFLSLGYSCPRKVLINSDVKLLNPLNEKELVNVNYPEEYQRTIDELREK